MRIAFQQVQQNIGAIANRTSYDGNFLYELLAAYGRSKSSISQLQSGQLNRADDTEAVLQKDVVYFRAFPDNTQLEFEVEKLNDDPLTERFRPRYIIATDYTHLAAYDTKKHATLSIEIADIDKHVDFFYGWTGDEIADAKTEAIADRRAAEKMKELYKEIEKDNLEEFAKEGSTFRHDLNVFFTRLLFCFFAEDTELFAKKQFTDAVKEVTQIDGSDLRWFFVSLFKSLDRDDKAGMTSPFSNFPYVNGTIFDTAKHSIAIPKFNAQARHLIIECGSLNWGEINPDIFGTLFQGIVDETKRDENGMDYTSVPNILKVIEPLFMDDLHGQFDKNYNDKKKLNKLLVRIGAIKIFDPACGSGNFLIIAYKELRRLENAILSRLVELGEAQTSWLVRIDLANFYGIEIDDFAHEIAALSLYLAKHQMDIDFEKQFGVKLKHLPLIENGNIWKANAARIDWNDVCPNKPRRLTPGKQLGMAIEIDGLPPEEQRKTFLNYSYDEIYLIGNPPYKGSKLQSAAQKADFEAYFGDEEYSGNLDYIAIWFIKGARYIAGTNAKLAFVSTNSVCQGEHVGAMFSKIFDENIEINFAYTSFKWKNSAKDNAGVTVVIIGLRNESGQQKYIYSEGIRYEVKNINAYLADSEQNIIYRASRPVSGLPEISFGSMPIDGGGLIVSDEDLRSYPEIAPYCKDYIGSAEFINGKKRKCLWLSDADYDKLKTNTFVAERIARIANMRSESKRPDTKKLASSPWRFGFISYRPSSSIIVPSVSSERREYIPMGYLGEDVIISNLAFAIYDAELWLFALLQSKMHMAWIRTVCGKLKTDYRYSATLGYNTFPVPPLNSGQKDELSKSARKILLVRENYSEKTLAEMYNPDKMPDDLREAHIENDLLVDSLYRRRGFETDEDRLASLFDLYEEMSKIAKK